MSRTGPEPVVVDLPSGAPARIATPPPGDTRLARVSLNQRTTERWTLQEAIDGCLRHGVPALGVWREPLNEVGVSVAARWLRDSGLRVSSLCRGGFFTAATGPREQQAAHEVNLQAIEEAAAIEAACLVLVPGGLPPGNRDLDDARSRVADAVAALVGPAADHGVRLALEPMHPIFAADRGVVSTLSQALDLVEPFPVDTVGVVVDSFHLWWEPGIAAQLARAGGRIASYQVSDWITPLPADTLLSRGMLGDGHIDHGAFTRALAPSYAGDVEVEILSQAVWDADPDAVVDTMVRRYVELVEPHL